MKNQKSDQQVFRGYIFSRSIEGNFIPQRVQNLVIKDYCFRKNIFFKLSATEYKMKNSFLMLKSLLEDLKSIDGIIFYSLFMLPYKKIDRKKIFNLIFKKKKKLIFALEEIILQNSPDIKNIENIFNIKKNSIKL
jgi:sporadic carbohydrate cluster protein (TIGR04323 family)